MAHRMPSQGLLEGVMYKSIVPGFAFFTRAIILGTLWAAEAWGGYWSWEPKETCAFIGLFVTLFAFPGVNMFLSGLHSYGEL